jgi:signal transduction histidine kinase
VSFAELLGTDPSALSNDDFSEFLRRINTGADRLRRLIEDLILLAELETAEANRIYESRKHILSAPLSILSDAANMVESFPRHQHYTISIAQPSAPLPSVEGDERYLKAAFICLIDNAVKFTEGSGFTVTLGLHVTDDGWLSFYVQDAGRGIPEEERERIYDMFYQIDRKRYEDQGTGIGLRIVKRIVDLHQGMIRLESAEGVGSTFTIALPPKR